MSTFTSKEPTVTAVQVTGSDVDSLRRPKTANSPAQQTHQLVIFPPFLDDHAPVLNKTLKTQTATETQNISTAFASLKAISQQSKRPSIMSRVATAVSKAASTAIGPGNPIIGPTPDSEVHNLKQVYQRNYFKHHTFRDERMFQGSEGEVYVISNVDKPESLVVKHTKATRLSREQAEKGELPHEAKMLLKMILPHPRIVAAFDCLADIDAPGRHKIFMEYCNAGSLTDQYMHSVSRLRGPMPEVFLLHVLVQGMEALAYLHHGLRYVGTGQYTQDTEHIPIVHADVKDDNFLLTWDVFPLPEVKLADFGTTKFMGERDRKGLVGTMCFHAPEDVAFYGDLQPTAENAWAFDAMIDARTTASDMYAFGLMMYMFASRDRRPARIGTDPSSMRISREYDTPGLLELLQKMLVIDPAGRAEASFHAVNGILSQIDEMRSARDDTTDAYGTTCWISCPLVPALICRVTRGYVSKRREGDRPRQREQARSATSEAAMRDAGQPCRWLELLLQFSDDLEHCLTRKATTAFLVMSFL
ncbi:hypothetical protein BST61_g5513 [Cercospora zeina]